MNIAIAAAGIGKDTVGGTAEGALFVALFSAVGFVLLSIAHVLLRRLDARPETVRYSEE